MSALAILFLLIGALLLLKKKLALLGSAREFDASRDDRGSLAGPTRRSVSDHISPESSPESSDEYWIPRDAHVEVTGTHISGGMLYVGHRLPSVASATEMEPALIDPSLPVSNSTTSLHDLAMPYWPSYSEISPSARRAYLTWLAGGRKEPDVDIGLAFIFFYGLERRALTDSRSSEQARSELPQIAAEVERLLGIYGDNGSFRSYAADFLVAVRLIDGGRDVELPIEPKFSYELPLALKVRLGRHASEGLPISAQLALAWAEHHPEIYFRTPAQRCRDEFRQLFVARYSEQYGEGMVLRRAKKRLGFEYRPASASYRSSIELDVGDLPDISALTQPVARLKELSDAVESELDSYSRYLGRRPENAQSLPALALLPAVLLEAHPSPALAGLRAWVEDKLADKEESTTPAAEFLVHWPFEFPSAPKKRELSAYAQLLGKLSIGFEPDPRFVSMKLRPEDQVVLFRISSDSAATPSVEFEASTNVIQLAVAVTAADGTVSAEEERHLEQHLTEAMDLSEAERRRLSAHLTWLLSNSPRLVTSKKRIQALSPSDKAQAAALLVALANADGRIDKEEVRLLEKVYSLLGLPLQQLYSDLHCSGPEDGPVVVESPAPRAEFAIPVTAPPKGSALDMSRVEKTLEETRSLQAMLGRIFSDEEQVELERTEVPAESSIDGLDAAHANLLRRLLERPEWPIVEFETLCDEEGVLPGGATEILNEFSFERVDLPLLEGEDPVVVDRQVAAELTH